jgi:hypothetical protein
MRQMIGAMFKGFRIGVDLEVTGQIVRSNRLVTGKGITLGGNRRRRAAGEQ